MMFTVQRVNIDAPDVEYIPWEGYSLPAYRVSLVISHHASRIMK
jgi:hypothetical protein